MATAILRPNGTASNTGPWTITGAATAHEAVDDAVTQPTAATTTDRVSTSTAGHVLTLDLGASPADVGTVTDVTIWVYNSTSGNDRIGVGLYEAGGAQIGTTGLATQNLTSTYTWHSHTISGLSLTKTTIDGARLRLTSGNSGGMSVVNCAAAYVEITYTQPGLAITAGNAGGATAAGQVATFAGGVPVTYEYNLVPNPSAEPSLSKIIGIDGASVSRVAGGVSGSWAADVVAVNPWQGLFFNCDTFDTDLAPLTDGETLVASVALSGTGTVTRFSVQAHYDEGGSTESTAVSVPLTGTMTRYTTNTVTLDPAKTCSYIYVVVGDSGGGTTFTAQVDAAKLTFGTTPGDYFDGSTGGTAEWLGTAWDSVSRREAAASPLAITAGNAGASTAAGAAATLTGALTATSTAGASTAAGQAATLAGGLSITATAGASTAAGASATLAGGMTATATAGEASVSGQAATLSGALAIAANAATGTAAGETSTLLGGMTLGATAGTAVATGETATLEIGTVSLALTADAGAAQAAGEAATFTAAFAATSDAASASAMGAEATLTGGLAIAAGAGIATAAGHDATLTSVTGDLPLIADAGTAQAAGQAAQFTGGATWTVTTGGALVGGEPATLTGGLALLVTPGAGIAAGEDATLTGGAVFDATAGTATGDGWAATWTEVAPVLATVFATMPDRVVVVGMPHRAVTAAMPQRAVTVAALDRSVTIDGSDRAIAVAMPQGET